MKRKVLAVMLSLMLIATMMPAVAFAEDDATNVGEIAFDNSVQLMTQTIDGEGTKANPWLIGASESDTVQAVLEYGFLDISGNGKMMDFAEGGQPWTGESIYSVYIDGSVTSIGDNAFNGFNTITSVTLSSGILSIGNYAFKGLSTSTTSAFKAVQIPDTVTRIGTGAFADCAKLSKVTLLSSVPATLGDAAFPDTTNLIVPLSAISAYKNSWSSYSNAIVAKCSVKINSVTGGKISLKNNSDIYSGDTITLRLLADTNYKYKDGSLVVTNEAGTEKYDVNGPTTVTENNIEYIQYTFTMPDADINVSAEFDRDGSDPAPTTYVCRIGTKKYTTLAAAVDKVRRNQTITLLADTDEELVIKRVITFKIDSNGHTNSSHIVGDILTVVDAKASTKNKDITIYTVSLRPISRETISIVVNRVLNAAEPIIRAIFKLGQIISK